MKTQSVYFLIVLTLFLCIIPSSVSHDNETMNVNPENSRFHNKDSNAGVLDDPNKADTRPKAINVKVTPRLNKRPLAVAAAKFVSSAIKISPKIDLNSVGCSSIGIFKKNVLELENERNLIANLEKDYILQNAPWFNKRDDPFYAFMSTSLNKYLNAHFEFSRNLHKIINDNFIELNNIKDTTCPSDSNKKYATLSENTDNLIQVTKDGYSVANLKAFPTRDC